MGTVAPLPSPVRSIPATVSKAISLGLLSSSAQQDEGHKQHMLRASALLAMPAAAAFQEFLRKSQKSPRAGAEGRQVDTGPAGQQHGTGTPRGQVHPEEALEDVPLGARLVKRRRHDTDPAAGSLGGEGAGAGSPLRSPQTHATLAPCMSSKGATSAQQQACTAQAVKQDQKVTGSARGPSGAEPQPMEVEEPAWASSMGATAMQQPQQVAVPAPGPPVAPIPCGSHQSEDGMASAAGKVAQDQAGAAQPLEAEAGAEDIPLSVRMRQIKKAKQVLRKQETQTSQQVLHAEQQYDQQQQERQSHRYQPQAALQQQQQGQPREKLGCEAEQEQAQRQQLGSGASAKAAHSSAQAPSAFAGPAAKVDLPASTADAGAGAAKHAPSQADAQADATQPAVAPAAVEAAPPQGAAPAWKDAPVVFGVPQEPAATGTDTEAEGGAPEEALMQRTATEGSSEEGEAVPVAGSRSGSGSVAGAAADHAPAADAPATMAGPEAGTAAAEAGGHEAKSDATMEAVGEGAAAGAEAGGAQPHKEAHREAGSGAAEDGADGPVVLGLAGSGLAPEIEAAEWEERQKVGIRKLELSRPCLGM